MKTIAEIRLENLELLIAEHGTQDRVAELGGTSSVYLSQVKNKSPDKKTGKLRQMGDDMARKLELGCGKEIGWMDNIHSEVSAVVTSAVGAAITLPIEPAKYDLWTNAAIDLLQELDIAQRQAMVARMREFRQYLGPPRDGQTLPMAG